MANQKQIKLMEQVEQNLCRVWAVNIVAERIAKEIAGRRLTEGAIYRIVDRIMYGYESEST